jgi:PIN domain nuclease of toxin-antitoxin system
MSVLEVAELFERGRIRSAMTARAWTRNALATNVELLPLTAEIAVDAAQLRFSNDPFDRVIYATARAGGGRLVTRDEALLAFDPTLAIW